MERTPLQQLSAMAVNVPDIVEWAAERNAAGDTFATIAATIADALGWPVSRETVRLWVRDAVASTEDPAA